MPLETDLMKSKELKEDLYNRFYVAAKECIPTYKRTKYVPAVVDRGAKTINFFTKQSKQ